MSGQETWVGTIVPIERNDGESDNVYFERVAGGEWATKNYLSEDIEDAIHWNCLYKDFICIENTIFKLDAKEITDGGCYCNLEPLPDGGYSFSTSFYNGGTYLEEMLQEEVKSLKKD